MNSDSTVSADAASADAEGVAEHSQPQADPSPRRDAALEPPDAAAAKEGEASSDESTSPASAPPGLDAEASAVEHTEENGEPHVPDSPPVSVGESGTATDAETHTPVAGAEPEAAVADVSEASAPSEASPAAGGEKRKLRLNPKLVGSEARAVPSLGGAPAPETNAAPESSAGTQAPAPVPEEVAAEEDSKPVVAATAPPPPPATPVEVPESDTLDAAMEAEIAAAMQSGELETPGETAEQEAGEQQQEAAAQAAPPSEEDIAEGVKLSGVIQSIHEDNVFLDFGLRQSGVVSKRQFGPKKEPKVGDRLEVVVTKVDEDEGLIVCSLPRGAARIAGDWNAVAVGQTVECMVTKTNKGGLEVTVSNLRGFMPASQVDIGYVSDLKPFVGQKLTARVTEVNPGRKRLVLSRRELLAEERAEAEAALLSHLEVGQTLSGQVKTIKDYGAFVDLGGVDGFLHIGQMSWVRIEHPNELLSEGQDVEVKILTIEPDKKDPSRKRIGLGMRQLVANPWANAEDKFPKGSTQTGKVTRTETYGAFVELEPGVEGLVHISELDHQRVKRVTEVLNVGQHTEVQVLEVDRKRKRISLSVKALTAAPEPDTASDEDLAPGGGQPYERKRKDDLKGGIGGTAPGGLFGNPNDFS